MNWARPCTVARFDPDGNVDPIGARAAHDYRVQLYGERWDALRATVIDDPMRNDVSVIDLGPLPPTAARCCAYPGCMRGQNGGKPLCAGHDKQLGRNGFMREIGTMRKDRAPKLRWCPQCGFAMKLYKSRKWGCRRCARERMAQNYRRERVALNESPAVAV